MNKYTMLSLLILTACTQAPAQVSLKGQESFSKSGNSTAGKYTNKYTEQNSTYNPSPAADTQQTVKLDSVGVNDLAPPTITNKPILQKPQTTNNPWTNKPHDIQGNE